MANITQERVQRSQQTARMIKGAQVTRNGLAAFVRLYPAAGRNSADEISLESRDCPLAMAVGRTFFQALRQALEANPELTLDGDGTFQAELRLPGDPKDKPSAGLTLGGGEISDDSGAINIMITPCYGQKLERVLESIPTDESKFEGGFRILPRITIDNAASPMASLVYGHWTRESDRAKERRARRQGQRQESNEETPF